MKLEWIPDPDDECDERLYVNGEYFGLVCKQTLVWSGDNGRGRARTYLEAKHHLEDSAWVVDEDDTTEG